MSNDRNAPCPCGSGRKYKHCCLGKQETPPSKWKRNLIASTVVVAAIALLVWAQSSPNPATGGARSEAIQRTGEPPLGQNGVPPPYYYDRQNNRHWDPDHRHWHDGPPPSLSRPVAAPEAGTTPPPYYYDAANDRHWHAEHGHWHDGPPPTGVEVP